jgi:type I restriction enzyme, S subunit
MIQEQNGKADVNLPALPSGWCWTTLATIAEIEGGITKDQKRQRTDSMREVPYLRVANVQRNYLDLREIKTILAEDDEISAMRLRKGDVLFTEGGDRDKLGRGWVWNDEIKECIHQNHIFRARLCLPLAEPKFVSYHGNFFGQQWFTATGKQTTNLASINKGVLSRFPVPLAPLNEQRRIVAKIEELFSDLDAGVAALNRIKANLKRYRAAVLKAAVEGKLTEEWRAKHPKTEPASKLLECILTQRRKKWEEDQLAKFAAANKTPPKDWREKYVEPVGPDTSTLPELPGGWCWTRVDQVGDVQLGRQRSPKHHNGPYMRPYLRVANVFEDRIDINDVMEMNFAPDEYETYHLTYGDVLLNEGQSMELVGRPAIYRDELPGACFTNTLVRFRARQGVEPSYALKVFLAYLKNGRFQKIATITVNIAHLGAGRFAEIEFPLPPIEEQSAIIDEVDRHFSVIDAAEKALDVNFHRAGRLRQSILTRAFEGRLVPQDPTDEPADKLLDRIRQEHATNNGSPASHTQRSRALRSAR